MSLDDARTAEGLPTDGEEPVFDSPWQARAFALAVATTDTSPLDWHTFQAELVAAIDDGIGEDGEGIEEVYYRQWLTAIETLLVDRGVVDAGALADRVDEFEVGERDASEFVEGDPHGHSHGHDH
ncbi:nitrile hydratase accessory protein [Natronorarus salvus]|uniref:nitrile hydratase accessory protein n=1 Tax=Natronorarus salvus TaxID=3117733 RepID=UPI002F262BFC